MRELLTGGIFSCTTDQGRRVFPTLVHILDNSFFYFAGKILRLEILGSTYPFIYYCHYDLGNLAPAGLRSYIYPLHYFHFIYIFHWVGQLFRR